MAESEGGKMAKLTVSNLIAILSKLPPNMEVTTPEPDSYNMFTLESVRLATASRTTRFPVNGAVETFAGRVLVIRGPRDFRVMGASELIPLEVPKAERD